MSEQQKTEVKSSSPLIHCNSVEPLSLSGNVANNWKKWYQSFTIYLQATGLCQASDERKIALLLHSMGPNILEIYNTFNPKEVGTYTYLIKQFDDYFLPRTNITYENYRFFTRYQKIDESLEDFMTDLINKSRSCEFGKLTNRITKDIFICNMHEKYKFIKEKLLQENDLTLEKAFHISKTMLQSQEQAYILSNNKNEYINYNKMRKYPVKSASVNHKPTTSSSSNKAVSSFNKTVSKSNNKMCGRCGQIHRSKCPAYNVICNKCKKKGHYQVMCRSTVVNYCQVSESNDECQGNSYNHFFISHLMLQNNLNNSDWNIDLKINNIIIKCILDTGSDANVMPLNIYKSLNICSQLKPCHVQITSYSGNNVKIVGKQTITCYFNNKLKSNILFIIADVQSPTVIGKNTCTELGLVKRIFNINEHLSSNNINLQDLLNKYQNVFEGLGCLPGEYHLTINSDVQPRVDAPRKIPFALHNRLKKELEKMEELNVIVKVTDPTPWVSSLILVEKKNGQLRICLDPRNLNKAICRSHYPIPTNDFVRSKLHGASYFSTLDANSGFWICRLDEESSLLTTFNTPFGRYRFKRLPYGINCAPEIFHRIMTETFGLLPGVIVYADDVLVYGSTINEHNINLQRVLQKAQEVNLKFNKSKCVFGTTTIKYLGHIYSKNGVSPDPEKVKAVKEMPSPTCVKDLQRFLGILNYLGGFIKNLASETESLRGLIKKSCEFQWNATYEKIYNHLKDIICQAPVLAHFDPKQPIVLSVDSSQAAVGAVLLQNNHPICYASQSLTNNQQQMAQIEKELYAIVFGCLRFHQYIYGSRITVETDHRPLITLFKKSLVEVPTRLQRLMLKIQVYDLQVEYKQGSKMFIADTLSRAALPETSVDELDEDIVIHVNFLIKNLPISEQKTESLIKATNEDKCMQLLKMYYKQGWPENKSHVNPLVLPYWNYRHDIHVIKEIVFRNSSLVIPSKLRSEMLRIIHSAHQGIAKSLSFVRGIIFWPSMSNDIRNMIQKCETCMSYRSANVPEPLMSHEICKFPWQKVGIDFLSFKGQTILIVEDYYSNYIEIANMSTISAKCLINALKPIFSRHGIPVELMSDNGPPYNSNEFKDFLCLWGIQHKTSSPYLARSNGLVESGVKIVKQILTKCNESGTDPYLALLQYRTTPRGNIPSPSQLLMSRSLRTQMPITIKHLKPTITDYHKYHKNKRQNMNKQQYYYNKKARKLPKLHINEHIWYKKKPEQRWLSGKIIKQCKEPRSFIIESEGNTYRRNRQHILKPIVFHDVNEPKDSNLVLGNKEIESSQMESNSNCQSQSQHNQVKMSRYGREIRPPVRYQDIKY